MLILRCTCDYGICQEVTKVGTFRNVRYLDLRRRTVGEGEDHLVGGEGLLTGQDKVVLRRDLDSLLPLRARVQDNGKAATGVFACDFFHFKELGCTEADLGDLVHREAAAVRAGQSELHDQSAQKDLCAAFHHDLGVTVMEFDGIRHNIRGESVGNNGQICQDSVLRREGGLHRDRFVSNDMVDLYIETVDHGVLHTGQVDRVGQRDRHEVFSACGQQCRVDRNIQPDIAGPGKALRRAAALQQLLCSGNRNSFRVLKAERVGDTADVGIAHGYFLGRESDRLRRGSGGLHSGHRALLHQIHHCKGRERSRGKAHRAGCRVKRSVQLLSLPVDQMIQPRRGHVFDSFRLQGHDNRLGRILGVVTRFKGDIYQRHRRDLHALCGGIEVGIHLVENRFFSRFGVRGAQGQLRVLAHGALRDLSRYRQVAQCLLLGQIHHAGRGDGRCHRRFAGHGRFGRCGSSDEHGEVGNIKGDGTAVGLGREYFRLGHARHRHGRRIDIASLVGGVRLEMQNAGIGTVRTQTGDADADTLAEVLRLVLSTVGEDGNIVGKQNLIRGGCFPGPGGIEICCKAIGDLDHHKFRILGQYTGDRDTAVHCCEGSLHAVRAGICGVLFHRHAGRDGDQQGGKPVGLEAVGALSRSCRYFKD